VLLRPGETCWRVERADRVALLMENAAYFKALEAALPLARKSITLLGWQFDPRTRLDPEGPAHDRGGEVGFLLRRLVRERPELQVRILIWRSPLPIAWSQDFFPQRSGAWFRKNKGIDFRLDRARPLGACHHQKVLVIDDVLAFCGGGDIAVDRWDTDEHLDRDPRRCTPAGLICSPRHEVMTLIAGPAASALGDLARERWRLATDEVLEPCPPQEPIWPEGIAPDLTNVTLGIARTEPEWRGHPEVRENEALHLEAVARAERLIYLENQYVTSPVIAAALAERLQQPEGPEVVIVSTGKSPSWFDQATMDSARLALLGRLRAADRHGRFSAWMPLTEGRKPVIVHSKVSVVDDRFLRVGSTNLNNRSAGFDTECDVAVEARPDDRDSVDFIRRFRLKLLSHFLACEAEDLHRLHQDGGSLAEAIRTANRRGRLAAIDRPPGRVSLLMSEWQLGDPGTTRDAWRPWRRGRLSHRLIDTVRLGQAEAEAEAEAGASAGSISKSTISGR